MKFEFSLQGMNTVLQMMDLRDEPFKRFICICFFSLGNIIILNGLLDYGVKIRPS